MAVAVPVGVAALVGVKVTLGADGRGWISVVTLTWVYMKFESVVRRAGISSALETKAVVDKPSPSIDPFVDVTLVGDGASLEVM